MALVPHGPVGIKAADLKVCVCGAPWPHPVVKTYQVVRTNES